jgi:tRNA dimethylallyltransferase
MDIGTGKISTSARHTVPHFGLDLLNLSKKYSVYQYFHDVSRWFDQLEVFEGEVWLSGGTGFYIRTVVEGLTLGAPPVSVRDQLVSAIANRGAARIAEDLKLEVPDAQNPHRVLRAVEAALVDPRQRPVVNSYFGLPSVLALTRSPRTPAIEGWQCEEIAVLDPGREELSSRIEARVRAMFLEGLLAEAQLLIDQGYRDVEVFSNGIGYREAIAMLEGAMNLEQAVAQTIVRTRQYAKRQRTYFRGQGWPFYREEELPFDSRISGGATSLPSNRT